MNTPDHPTSCGSTCIAAVVASDVREIKLAVVGDPRIGLPGLVEDMRRLKEWQRKIDLRVASISGGVTTIVLLVKFLLTTIH